MIHYQMHQTPGVTKETSDFWTIDEIHERFADITRLEDEAPAAGDGCHPVNLATKKFPSKILTIYVCHSRYYFVVFYRYATT